jgi:hypothetical protein
MVDNGLITRIDEYFDPADMDALLNRLDRPTA